LTQKGRASAARAMGVVHETYQIIMDGIDESVANDVITRLENNLDAILRKLATKQRSPIDPT